MAASVSASAFYTIFLVTREKRGRTDKDGDGSCQVLLFFGIALSEYCEEKFNDGREKNDTETITTNTNGTEVFGCNVRNNNNNE